MTSKQIEQRLSQLPHAVAWPETGDVTPAVRSAITTTAMAPAEQARRRWWPGIGRPAIAAVVLVIVGALALVVSPGARHAVATWFAIPGIDLRLRDEVTMPPPEQLRLGQSVTLPQAQEQVDFPIRTLQLGAPGGAGAEVFIDRRVPGGIVHVVYPEQRGLPAGAREGIGAVLTQFRTPDGEPLFTKETLMSDTEVSPATVDGEFAVWTSGASHVVIPNRGGAPVRDEARLSENALLWSSGGVTYRLETALSMAEAITVAETLR